MMKNRENQKLSAIIGWSSRALQSLLHRLFKVAGTVYGVVFIVASQAMNMRISTLKLENKTLEMMNWWSEWFEKCVLLKKPQCSNSPAHALGRFYFQMHPLAFMSRRMVNGFTCNYYNYHSFSLVITRNYGEWRKKASKWPYSPSIHSLKQLADTMTWSTNPACKDPSNCRAGRS